MLFFVRLSALCFYVNYTMVSITWRIIAVTTCNHLASAQDINMTVLKLYYMYKYVSTTGINILTDVYFNIYFVRMNIRFFLCHKTIIFVLKYFKYYFLTV